ncbi:MAG: TIGR03000 domain-containing protein [Gemmataceae bacterium]
MTKLRARTAAVFLGQWWVIGGALVIPGEAQAGPHKPDYQTPPADWQYYNLPPGPYLTTAYPFAGWPGYRGSLGGLWTHGPGPHRPPVPVYAPIPAMIANPDPVHLPKRSVLGFGVGYYGWVGPYRASPRHLPTSVSVYAPSGGPNVVAAGPAGSCLTLRVSVPAGAELYVDGVKTAQAGADRVFESPPTAAGRDVRYELTARWVENGTPVERTQSVGGKAGETVRVEFGTGTAARE